MKRIKTALVALAFSLIVALPAMAQETGGGEYSQLTSAVDWSSVGSALLAVGSAIIGIFVTFKGIKLVTRAVKGA